MTFAYWRKCDFQVHSPRDPNWAGARPTGIGQDLGGVPATAADVDAQRIQWAAEFVEACVIRALQVVALTDHHEMIMVPYVQQAIADRKAREPAFDLWLLPGMELTCRNGVQSLIIFDADLSEEWRREAQSQLGIVVADLEEKAHQAPRVTQLPCTYPGIATQLDAVDGLRGKYIVLPNVSQGGQHTVLTTGAHADFKAMPYVGGYLDRGQSITTLQATNRRRLSGEDRMWSDRSIYPLPTSDARSADYAALGSNSCWIKLAAPTAEAIRQAFLGHQSRIAIERPATPSRRSAKTIMGWTGVSDHTARAWLHGQKSPSGVHLLALAANSSSVMSIVLRVTGHAGIAVKIDLRAIEQELVATLAAVRKLRIDDA